MNDSNQDNKDAHLMRTYRYDCYAHPQQTLDHDNALVKNILDECRVLRNSILYAVRLSEDPGLEKSLSSLGKAFDDFISDEVEPIMTLLENAQDDIDKETTA